VLAVPTFFEAVFYLMIPLARAMGVRSPKSYALLVMAIISGAAMAHSLCASNTRSTVSAGALGVNLGLNDHYGIDCLELPVRLPVNLCFLVKQAPGNTP